MSSSNKFPLGALIGIGVLALAGVGLLVFAMYSIFGTPSPTMSATQAVAQVASPTRILIPTTTPAPAQPSATSTSVVPTDTAPPPTDAASAATATTAPATGPMVEIVLPANVRTGPGTNYPTAGGIEAGRQVAALGRDSTATWFVISYSAAPNGQGWVSNQVARYTGDVNSLTVIAAPPPPAPTKTPVPAATQPPAAATQAPKPPPSSGNTSRGMRGDSFSVRSTNVTVGEAIWFDFQVTNTTEQAIPYGALSAYAAPGVTGKSWANATLNPGKVLVWSDHFKINTAGTYQVYLGVCWDSASSCFSGGSGWDQLSPSITVVVR